MEKKVELQESDLENVNGGVQGNTVNLIRGEKGFFRVTNERGIPFANRPMVLMINGTEYRVFTDMDGMFRFPGFDHNRVFFQNARIRLEDDGITC